MNFQANGASGEVSSAITLGVNASADEQNRLTVSSEATLFNHEGSGHQLKINKNTSEDRASILFQDGFSGRAEMGNLGDDDFHLRVSSDNQHWFTGLSVDRRNGGVHFPNGANADQVTPAVANAGGDLEVAGPPNLATVSYNRATISMSAKRIYFCPFFVDRPTLLTGGLIVMSRASTEAGALIRAGVYSLGEANGNNWHIGDRVADFGTHPADTAGLKDFSLAEPALMPRGWYVTAVGISGQSAQLRYSRWMTPGQLHYIATGSGSSVELRISGAGTLLFDDDRLDEIANGFPAVWPNASVRDAETNYDYVRQVMIPKWRRW